MNRKTRRAAEAVQKRPAAASPAQAAAPSLAEALQWHNAGRLDAALAVYARILAAEPAHADALHFTGVVHLQRGDHATAVGWIRRALAVNAMIAAAWSNLGVSLLALGEVDQAIAAYDRAIALEPNFANAYNNRANALAEKGDKGLAAQSYRQAVALRPTYFEAYNGLGLALINDADPAPGIAAFEQALAIKPDYTPALGNLATIRRREGRIDEARQLLDRAIGIDAQPGFQIRRALMIPPIVGLADDIAASRAAVERNLDALAGAGLKLAHPEKEAETTNFFFAYHGCNNRALHTRIGRMFLDASPALGAVAPHCVKPRKAGGRIKVGFISQFMRHHSIGKTTSGLIAELDKDRFESHALFVAPMVDDEVSRFIRASADHSTVVPRDLARARAAIAALELDVLFYQDIGMEPFTYFLAFARLAPVQCLSFGHPDTTGIPNMDYFVSSDLFEIDGAEAHYSETLFKLRDLGTLAYYYKPKPPTPGRSRADLGLPAEGRIYLCPQTLFKLHPDFDAIVGQILRADPDGHVVLISQGLPSWSDLTRQRLTRSIPDVAGRVRFIAPQLGGDFQALLEAADVVLDTVHFNGMNTSLEAFSVGSPVVTLPTDQHRGRHTQGMYRKMGIADCIAEDAADYVRIALRLAREPAYRAEVKARILARNSALYEDKQVVREFERFFSEAVARL